VKVAIAYDVGQPLVVEDHPVPDIGPRDVAVRIAASGICHTDLVVLAGGSPTPMPVVAGHEACGTVEAVGPEVRRVRVGDRVLASVSPACGSCWWCLRGMTNMCERGPLLRNQPRFHTSDGRPVFPVAGCGSFAEAMVVDEASVVPVQTDLPDEQLALLGCGVTTGLAAALVTGDVQPGSSVAVIGCGGVGQSVVQGARIAGASMIIAIDPAADRRNASLRLGATHGIDPTEQDPVAQVRELTSGRGADYTFEAVGKPALMTQAYEMARNYGSVVLIGMPDFSESFTISAASAVFSCKRILGTAVGGAQILRDFPRFIGFAESGQLDIGSMVSHRITLDQVNDGIAAMERADGTRTVIV
jgi:S-(hydroxymethyl)glutathione dehydrogenase/alcohol dehydrogenase